MLPSPVKKQLPDTIISANIGGVKKYISRAIAVVIDGRKRYKLAYTTDIAQAKQFWDEDDAQWYINRFYVNGNFTIEVYEPNNQANIHFQTSNTQPS